MPSQVTQRIGYVTLPWNYIYVVFWANYKIYLWTNNLSNTKILTATCTVLILTNSKTERCTGRCEWVKKHMRARKCHLVCTLNTAAHTHKLLLSLYHSSLFLFASCPVLLLNLQTVAVLWPGLHVIDHFPTANAFSYGCLLFCVSKINSRLANKHICLFMIFLFLNVFYYFTNLVKRCNIFWM